MSQVLTCRMCLGASVNYLLMYFSIAKHLHPSTRSMNDNSSLSNNNNILILMMISS